MRWDACYLRVNKWYWGCLIIRSAHYDLTYKCELDVFLLNSLKTYICGLTQESKQLQYYKHLYIEQYRVVFVGVRLQSFYL